MNLTRTPPAHSRDRLKWLRLRALPERDSQSDGVQHLAKLLREASGGNTRLFVALCHAMARDGIHFVSDVARVGHEDIAGVTRAYGDPLEALERGADDCDASARLCVALLLAGGLGARLADWWDVHTGDLDHVGAEVMLDGQWRHLECILSRARIGDLPADVPVEVATGKWRYS
jgi:hypothetical protein